VSDEKAAGGFDWRSLLRQSFGPSFWIFVAAAAVMGVICYLVLGEKAFSSATARDSELLLDLLPRVVAAQIVAGLVWALFPRERISALLARNSGRRGLILAALGGIITPGGPASAFPLLAILAGAGADRGILVSYITSWALLGVQRMIVWDVPLMGVDFSVLRFAVSLPLPILAGYIARRISIGVDPADA
jgi:uncharacterized membrane protein YraQ (UPF0718 family)